MILSCMLVFADNLDHVAAFVNKNIITENQLDQRIAQDMLRLKAQRLSNIEFSKDFRQQTLNTMITEYIQLDLVNKYGIKTNDEEINDAINSIAENKHMSLNQLLDELKSQGTSFDTFRTQVKQQILFEKLKYQEVDSKIWISDEDINRLLTSASYKNAINYNISYIMINADSSHNDQREKIAQDAYNALIKHSFAQVAMKYSDAPNALGGGDLGWKSNTSLPPYIVDELNKLEPGEHTKIIKLPIGFFIFKLNDIKRSGMQQIVKQYHVRHILVKINEINSENSAYQKILHIKQRIDDQLSGNLHSTPADIEQVFSKYAREYSSDTSSVRDGDIGWISAGDLVPNLERAIFKAPLNTVMGPIRTNFGWHLFVVVEVRDTNLTADKAKHDARMELFHTREMLAYMEWLISIRKAAYVKIP
jgi:peptidyl-prolyl cis-trans isomerase SurA